MMRVMVNLAATPNTIEVLNPFNDSVVGLVPDHDAADVEQALEAAERGFRISRALPRYERARILERTAMFIEEEAEVYARLIACESGKVLRAARKEVRRCINTLKLSAEEAKRLGGEVIPFDSYPGSERRTGYYRREPIGVIVAITPFNDPLNLVAHKLGPAIASGNSVVLKLSELAPLSGIRLAELFRQAGLPADVITIITGKGSVVGPPLVSAPLVRLVSFTGGFKTAHAIKESMGLARITMDLGGNGSVIVLDDCDLERAALETTSGAFWAAGQNCIGVQRVFVQNGIFDRFVDRVKAHTQKLVVGDPLEETSDMGPMISLGAAKRADAWIKEAIAAGADLVVGGDRKGTLLQPTVLTNVPDTARLACDEAFAPVVCINSIGSLDEGIARTNASAYAIHAAIFTRNLDAALSAADELEAGGVMINDSTDYRLDAMPFGGVKAGSLGREGVRFAIEEMTQTKVICFNR
ncbi:aldehyde dehydrogenase family protein (plasmid) [Nitrobacteraceae bacterium UC4449_H16]